MKFYIVRHGVTQWNALKKVQGAADIPLAEAGVRLAEATGKALKDVPFDICFTSPLKRARQTAELILGERKVPVIPDKRIQEIDFGVLEGTRFRGWGREIYQQRNGDLFSRSPPFYKAERWRKHRRYLQKDPGFLGRKITDPDLAGKTILLASHGCAVRAILQNVYEDKRDFWHGCVPPNCCVNVVEVKDGKAVLLEEDKVYA